MDNITRLKDKLIMKLEHLVQLFDSWVLAIKANDLERAKNLKDLANLIRKEVVSIKSDIEKEKNKKIILLKN